jgi:hypothetical protein
MEREQLKNLIREVLAEVLSPIVGNQPEPTEQWVPLTNAWRSMGYPSYDALYADVQAGLFRVGKEVRDRRKAGAKIARYQIDVVAAGKRLKQNPSMRRAV